MDEVRTRNTLPKKSEKFLHKTFPYVQDDMEAAEWYKGAHKLQFNA